MDITYVTDKKTLRVTDLILHAESFQDELLLSELNDALDFVEGNKILIASHGGTRKHRWTPCGGEGYEEKVDLTGLIEKSGEDQGDEDLPKQPD